MRLFESLKARILKSIITWSTMGKQTAQAKEVYCFGFIDGTVRPICRPKQNQRIVYNGHKRVHGLKCQSVVLPSGMIANMYGPVGNFCNLINLLIPFLFGEGDIWKHYTLTSSN